MRFPVQENKTISFAPAILILVLLFVSNMGSCVFGTENDTTEDDQGYTHAIYRINISKKCVRNNSVGNDWYFEYWINGESFYSGYELVAPLDRKLEKTIRVKITEDDSYPDTAMKEVGIPIRDGVSDTLTLTVKENKGRYAGNTATWEVTITVTLVEKIIR